MKLNNSNTELKINDGTVLKVGQSIDFKSATETRTSIGRIEQFKMVDTDSPWMQVADMGELEKTEWISCTVWNQQVEDGIFNNTKKEVNGSTEPEDTTDRPF